MYIIMFLLCNNFDANRVKKNPKSTKTKNKMAASRPFWIKSPKKMTCISNPPCTTNIPSLNKISPGISEKRLMTCQKCDFGSFLGLKWPLNDQKWPNRKITWQVSSQYYDMTLYQIWTETANPCRRYDSGHTHARTHARTDARNPNYKSPFSDFVRTGTKNGRQSAILNQNSIRNSVHQ